MDKYHNKRTKYHKRLIANQLEVVLEAEKKLHTMIETAVGVALGLSDKISINTDYIVEVPEALKNTPQVDGSNLAVLGIIAHNTENYMETCLGFEFYHENDDVGYKRDMLFIDANDIISIKKK